MDREDRRCVNCRFCNIFVRKSSVDGETRILECRRHAPRMFSGSGEGWSGQLFPEMSDEDWCGEWQEK